ncbi:MAG TPA: DUF3006 domain-containing protein [Ruminococcaceae bacterium]|jgi:hypothetical protein|nr:DUF3006 domain-containing protein [Oscillospiraceae bacterium]HCA30399.1 DUF3006 domain-containing protein [Oscillospiraceae bacterium]
MKYAIDRFEEDIAVLQDDDGNCTDVKRALLPEDVRQGDVLIYENQKWRHDAQETSDRRKKVLSLQERILKKKK